MDDESGESTEKERRCDVTGTGRDRENGMRLTGRNRKLVPRTR